MKLLRKSFIPDFFPAASNPTIIKIVLPLILLLTGIFNVSGQTKADKLDQRLSTYAEYGKFNGSVLVAEKGNVITKRDSDWPTWNGMFPINPKVTSKSYEQVLPDNSFTPLKMKNTGYDHNATLLKNRARA